MFQIFEEGTTKAVGVVLVTSEGATSSDASADAIAPGVETELYANKEVLISAGAFQSPQLLMVSGVGPREALEKLGIDVVVDLAGVGQGMEDHSKPIVCYFRVVFLKAPSLNSSEWHHLPRLGRDSQRFATMCLICFHPADGSSQIIRLS